MRRPTLTRRPTVARAALAVALLGLLCTSSAVAARSAPSAPPDRLVFPLVGKVWYTDDFGAPRPQGSHEGNDIVGDWRAPVVAVEDGKVQFHTTSARAGCMLYLYGKSGTTYLYIHLNEDLTPKNDGRGGCKPGVAYAEGLKDGARVKAGELIGYNGSSGDAGATNHLHFELHPNGGAAVSPFRWLKRAERLLFAVGGAALERATAEAPTLTLTGTVEKVELVEAPPAEDPVDDGAPAEDPAAGQAQPSVGEGVGGTGSAGDPPAAGDGGTVPIIGRAVQTALLTVRTTEVKLSAGGTFEVERLVTISVPADALVQRDNGKRVKNAKLEAAQDGERVTLTTGVIDYSLKTRLARPGVLAAATIVLRGKDD